LAIGLLIEGCRIPPTAADRQSAMGSPNRQIADQRSTRQSTIESAIDNRQSVNWQSPIGNRQLSIRESTIGNCQFVNRQSPIGNRQ
jgi:hypothetical protein